MLESASLQTSLTASFVLCTQLLPLNSRPITGPRKKEKNKLAVNTLVSVHLITKKSFTEREYKGLRRNVFGLNYEFYVMIR